MSQNPYESPVEASIVPTPDTSSEMEATRLKYLPHERAFKSISIIHFLGAGIYLILAIFAPGIGGFKPSNLAIAFGVGGLAVFFLALGLGVQRLRPWARIASAIVATIGTIGLLYRQTMNNPAGLVIALTIFIYILYVSLSRKGKYVCSYEYAIVRAATPHLNRRTKTSPIVLVFFFLLLFVIGFGLIAFLLSSSSVKQGNM